jgi:phosphoribosylformylglycinamidine synthase I
MSKPRVHILYAPGINCHHETADAFRLAGARPEFIHLTADLLEGRKRLTDCDLLAMPGGFAFGDHVAAGRIVAIDLLYRLREQLLEVREKKIPTVGICNGFQFLILTGLLPGTGEIGEAKALLDRNLSATFESRWVDVFVQKTDCVWTRGLQGRCLHIPVAHGEGRLLLVDDFDDANTVLRYGSAKGTLEYPANPNGSPGGRAGICDTSGLILGLMPHPERAIYPWHGSEDGLHIFKAGVSAVR